LHSGFLRTVPRGSAPRRKAGGIFDMPGVHKANSADAKSRAADSQRSVSRQLHPKQVDKRQTWAYIYRMKYLNWNSEKNEILKRERGISFEEIAYSIESGQVIGIEENPGYPNQMMYILEIDNYAIIVPYVENDDEIFLKTAFPSRKYTKKYGLKGE
jgi:hypothetical protein